jgi:CTP:molybdopterin cytidylyltransferase MocA
MKKICAIILAAGESKRMNEPKLLLPVNGRSMIEEVTGNVISSDVFHTLVVLGAYRNEIAGIIRHLPVKFCYNDNYKNGMLTSVKCGFDNLPEGYDAVLVFQGDQPFIRPEVTSGIIRAYMETGKGLVVPVFRNKRGHPLLIDQKYRELIHTIPENEGLRWILTNYPEDIFEVEVRSEDILRDIDTKEEYLNEINRKLIKRDKQPE